MRPTLVHATTALIVPMLLLFAAAPGRSQQPDRDVYTGEWILVSSVEDGRQTIRSAFDRALRDVNPFMRAMARQRINVDEMLVRRIRVAIDGPRITTTFHTTRPHRFQTRQDHPDQVTTENGNAARLTQLFRSGQMEMVFDMEEGRRWTVLTTEGSDRLTLTTTIDPTRLDDNIRYSLVYRRASAR